jgi:hypothetical protein
MWRWLERRSRLRRAKSYLRLYPRDEPAVRGILAALDSLHPKNARDAAEIANGRELSEAEWASYANRWEREPPTKSHVSNWVETVYLFIFQPTLRDTDV